MSALVFHGFQPFNPMAVVAIFAGMALVSIALLPTVKAKLVASVVLGGLLIVGASGLYAQEYAPPPTNNCCVVWIAGSPWCIGWWC